MTEVEVAELADEVTWGPQETGWGGADAKVLARGAGRGGHLLSQGPGFLCLA